MQNIHTLDPAYHLKKSKLLHKIRCFFYERNLCEVLTPLLTTSTTPSVYTKSFEVVYSQKKYYLQTSPEFGMKKLLCNGLSDCYQISSVFRCDEEGDQHALEFNMLEYYRLEFSAEKLMNECNILLNILGFKHIVVLKKYSDLFLQYLNIDIENFDYKNWINYFKTRKVNLDFDDTNACLFYAFSMWIEPNFSADYPFLWITHFPVTQQEFAKTSDLNTFYSLRFELYIQGIEIANGYEEMQTKNDYQKQFTSMLHQRKQQKKPMVCVDEEFIRLLDKKPLPACSGLALGLERLLSVL